MECQHVRQIYVLRISLSYVQALPAMEVTALCTPNCTLQAKKLKKETPVGANGIAKIK